MCSGQCYGVKRVKAGRRGRKSCASCSAATWWRAVGLEGRTKGAFGGCLTLKLAINAELLWGNCILAMKNRQKIRPGRPETENGLKMRHKGSVSYDILSKTDKMFDWYVY